jgi:hypothetical protein
MLSQIPSEILEYNVHVFRKNNLVYVATYKCGSTYFVSLLIVNGWERISLSDIDWHNNHVIAFIRNVKERYINGIIEDLYQTQTIEEPKAEEIEKIYEYLKKIASDSSNHFLIGSYHTVPITVILHDFIDKMHWIPISEGFDHNKEFFQICEEFNCPISIFEDENIDHHHTLPTVKLHQVDFSKLQPENCFLFKLYYSGDQILYNKAKLKYNLA